MFATRHQNQPGRIATNALRLPNALAARFFAAMTLLCLFWGLTAVSVVMADGPLLPQVQPQLPAVHLIQPHDHPEHWPPRPVGAEYAVPVELATEDLEAIREGSVLSFDLPDLRNMPGVIPVNLNVSHEQFYINGDRMLRAEDRHADVGLVLTLNDEAAFADLAVDNQRWLLHTERTGSVMKGWLYMVTGPVLQNPARDFVIPLQETLNQLSRPAADSPDALPLKFGDDEGSANTAGPTQLPSTSGLHISQTFSADVVFVGQSTEFEVTLNFRNQTSQTQNNLVAEVFFILEDAELLSAPACERRTTTSNPPQPILRCQLPGSLSPGATRSLNYVVRVPPKSAPMRLWSTVLVGQTRHDAFLNVVNDVVGGSATGELSTFNQTAMGGVSIDGLDNVVIDIMALYTPDAEALYGAHTATRINQLVSVANQIYQDSGVGITLRPVHHTLVNYPSAGVSMHTQLEQLTYGGHGAFSQVPMLRERYGADLVVLFRALPEQSDLCGLANLGGHRTHGDMTAFDERDYAFSLVAIDCPVSSVLAHEIGHNMGLTHSHREDGSGGTFPFSTGYGVDHQFVTVMASPARFNDASRISLFSSPDLDCAGMPCGVDHQDRTHGADAVRTLNLVRYQVANYMPTRVPFMPSRAAADINGRPTSARIAVAASTDKGLSFVQSASTAEKLDITANFYIDPAHVGRRGHFHVLADLSEAGMGFVQLNDKGEIFGWNGRVDNLMAYNATARLNAVEYLHVLSDFRPLPELQGTSLVLYIAYQLPETGELIYTSEPLTVNIQAGP